MKSAFLPYAFAAVLLSSSLSGFAADDLLRIYSGARPDTTASDTRIIVGVTVPGAEASINSAPVKVRRTGSFGAEVTLSPGRNVIPVTATLNGASATENVVVVYDPSYKAKVKAELDEPTTYFDTPLYVSTLPGAYLQYGNGDDRLGGSKMGFLAEDITLKVIGLKGSLYCVRLGADRLAYIPKSYVHPAAGATPVVNTGSWTVADVGDADRVTVSLPRRLPYQYITSSDPNTIIVDLFGATDNSNWITQRTMSLGIIDNVDFRQLSDDVYRVIIRLKGKAQWGFHVDYEGNVLTVDVRHAPRSLAIKDLTIGLDAGHGGEYPGAVSPSGLKEKDVNLDIVLRIQKLLEKRGAKVVMTRTGDTGPSMAQRKKTWLDGNVDIAISVHNNSGGSPLSSPGTAVLYKHQCNRALAMCLAQRMVQTGLPLFGVVGNFNFSLNGPTEYPNALIEGMFMSSLEEEELLADESFRQQVAEKIVAGLEDYLKSVR